MKVGRLSRLMALMLAGLLALDGAAIGAYVAGWDRVIAALAPSGITAGQGKEPEWRPPVLDADGSFRAKPYEAYVQTAARPLFSRTRRPFVAPVADAVQKAPGPVTAPVAPTEPEVGLLAIAIRGAKREALVVTRGEPLGRWFGEGEAIEGWKVSSMSADTLMLAAGTRTKTVQLYDQPGAAARVVAVPAARAAHGQEPQPSR